MTQPSILIVADDSARRRLAQAVGAMDCRVETVADVEAARIALSSRRWQAVLFATRDVRASDWRLLTGAPDAPPLVLALERGEVRDAMIALRQGASDVVAATADAATLHEALRPWLTVKDDDPLIAADPSLRELTALARRVAAKEVSVLLTGESGTGKELFAQYIHRHSARSEGPLVAVNCAAIPENMLEAVLFGYEKGAFTGAHRSHAGKFEQAQGGTLLLDEISEIDIGLQAKLLRVLQEREVERLCGHRTIPLDVRVIATTNRDLRAMVQSNGFREDLFYRLHVFPLHIPPLRERKADILALAQSFLARFADGRPLRLSESAEQALLGHDWPGNVRELENVLQRAAILSDDDVLSAQTIRFDEISASQPDRLADEGALEAEIKSSEHRVILDALQRFNGSRKAAAEQLGISDRTLRYKLARMRRDGVPVPTRFGAECA